MIKKECKEYFEQFVDRQAFEGYIYFFKNYKKNFNNRINRLIKSQNNLIDKLVIFENNFNKLNNAFIKLKLRVDLMDNYLQLNLIKKLKERMK